MKFISIVIISFVMALVILGSLVNFGIICLCNADSSILIDTKETLGVPQEYWGTSSNIYGEVDECGRVVKSVEEIEDEQQ